MTVGNNFEIDRYVESDETAAAIKSRKLLRRKISLDALKDSLDDVKDLLKTSNLSVWTRAELLFYIVEIGEFRSLFDHFQNHTLNKSSCLPGNLINSKECSLDHFQSDPYGCFLAGSGMPVSVIDREQGEAVFVVVPADIFTAMVR